MKKNWNNPELKNLAVGNTNDDNPNTRDWPHVFVCKGCGKHYYTNIIFSTCGCSCGSREYDVQFCDKGDEIEPTLS